MMRRRSCVHHIANFRHAPLTRRGCDPNYGRPQVSLIVRRRENDTQTFGCGPGRGRGISLRNGVHGECPNGRNVTFKKTTGRVWTNTIPAPCAAA